MTRDDRWMKMALALGGVPAKTFVGTPPMSASTISNMVPGAQTASQASRKLIPMPEGCTTSAVERGGRGAEPAIERRVVSTS